MNDLPPHQLAPRLGIAVRLRLRARRLAGDAGNPVYCRRGFLSADGFDLAEMAGEEEMTDNGKTYGQVSYEAGQDATIKALGRASGIYDIHGWEDIGPELQACNEASAQAVRAKTIEECVFTLECYDAQIELEQANLRHGRSKEYERGWSAALSAAAEMLRSLQGEGK